MKTHTAKVALQIGAREKWSAIMRGDARFASMYKESSKGDPLTMAVAEYDNGVWVALGVRRGAEPAKSNRKYLWVFGKDGFRNLHALKVVDSDADFMAAKYEWKIGADQYVLDIEEKKLKEPKRLDGDIVAELVIHKKAREMWGQMLEARAVDENGYAAPEELDDSPIVMGVGDFSDGCRAAMAVVKSGVPEYNLFSGWMFNYEGEAFPGLSVFSLDEATYLDDSYQAFVGDDDQNYVVHVVEKKKGIKNAVNFEFSPEADAEKFPEPLASSIAKYKKDFHGVKFLCLITSFPSNSGTYFRFLVKDRNGMGTITMHVDAKTGAVTQNGNMLLGMAMGQEDSLRDGVMKGSSLPEMEPAALPEPVLGYFNEAAKGKDYIPVKYIGVFDGRQYWVVCHTGQYACLLRLEKEDDGTPVRAQLVQLN